MKKLFASALLFVQVWTFALCFQAVSVEGQASPHKIEFTKLSDYVDDFNRRRDGERLIVSNVPSFDNMKFQKRYNMYMLEGEQPATSVGDTFYTSPALAKLLLTHLGTLTETFRITCTLIQFVSGQDVYRSPFATKIEGIDENGAVTWTISGPPPLKLKRPE